VSLMRGENSAIMEGKKQEGAHSSKGGRRGLSPLESVEGKQGVLSGPTYPYELKTGQVGCQGREKIKSRERGCTKCKKKSRSGEKKAGWKLQIEWH